MADLKRLAQDEALVSEEAKRTRRSKGWVIGTALDVWEIVAA